MAVVNRNDFTLQDVINEINPTTDDLVNCFADAVLGNFDSNYETNSAGTRNNLLAFRNYGASPPPVCENRIIVFQICNSNAGLDDNFDILLNNVNIGAVDLNENSRIGSVFIGSTNTSLTLSDLESDFNCDMADMVIYYFDPVILASSNVISMINTQNNGNSNYGTIGVRSYQINGTTLEIPREYTDLIFGGGEVSSSGDDFEFTFNFNDCGKKPSTPISLRATEIEDTTFTLSWADGSGDVTTTGYKVYKAGVLYSDVGNVLTIGITGQTAGNTNNWTVRAYNSVGDISDISESISVTQTDVSVYPVSVSPTGRSDSSSSCGDTASVTRYSSAEVISYGNIIYEDSEGITVFNGGGKWFKFGTDRAFIISSRGVLGTGTFCI